MASEEFEPMDDALFGATVKGACEEAADFIDGFIAPERALATDYYMGRPFGNEEEGRSQIVMTEVRDVVLSILPDLLRIFTAGPNTVEFVAQNAHSVEIADQQTDYCNLVFQEDNPGFLICHEWMKDALVRKVGIVTWRWNADIKITEQDYDGLDDMALAVIEGDPTIEILAKEEREVQSEVWVVTDPTNPDVMERQVQPLKVYDIKTRRSVSADRVEVSCVPPEEFICSRVTTSQLENSPIVGRRRYATISELVAMGYDEEEILENRGGGDLFGMNYEAQVRNPAIMIPGQDTTDLSMERVLYVEAYLYIDKDGDGIAELRKVCCLGEGYYILHDEIVEEAPFATLCPDPEPHTLFGQSITDQVADLQVIKSNIVRNTLDSLSQAVVPRMAVVEQQTNMDDVLNTEVGAVIRMRVQGAVQPITTPFVGQPAMGVISWLEAVRSQRTGVSPATQGLDPEIMQSTTKAAVDATVNGAQARTEMIARIFAETGFVRLFRGINRLVCQYQDKPRTVMLRGEWVQVDPRSWVSDLAMRVNVALGKGTDSDRIAMLTQIAAKQQEIIQVMGPDNPICSVKQYADTLAQIVVLGGFKDSTKYFKRISAQQLMEMAQAAEEAKRNQPPSPEQQLVEIEKQKVELKKADDERQYQLKVADGQLKVATSRADREAQAAAELARLETQKDIETEKARLDGETKLKIAIAQANIQAAAQIEIARIQAEASVQAAAKKAEAQPAKGATYDA